MCHGQVISEAIHKARKRHQCHECGKGIRPGQRYYRQNQVGSEGFGSYVAHTRCVALEQDMRPPGHWDECTMAVDARDAFREEAQYLGWKGLRRKMRALSNAFAAGVKRRQQ